MSLEICHVFAHTILAEPPRFVRIFDYKCGQNFENMENFAQLGKITIMLWSLLLSTEIAYKILENGVCYTEIQAARLEALTVPEKR